MKIITLPEELTPNEESDVLAYDYHVQQESTRQQVNLSMNTFSFLTEGRKEVHSDAKAKAISNSKFLLMKAGKCLMTEKFADEQNSYRSVLFFFTNEAALQFVRKYAILLPKTAERKTVQSLEYDEYLASFAKSLTDLIHSATPSRHKVLQLKFEELMLYLTDKVGTAFLASLILTPNAYEQHFRQVVENNKLNRLTLSELAFLCNMSLSTFKRTFEKHFHLSPSKWFQERRLEHSAILLKNEEKRPTDIYLEIGYDSLSNYIKAFKSKYGVTPKQYQSS